MIDTGIYFGDIHTFYDLKLILSSVDIPPAKPKTTYISIPGGNGDLDLTEAHGDVKFSSRDCTFTFTVAPADCMPFEERKSVVSNALNGLKCRIILDKDSDYYYIGRLSVDEYRQDRNLKQIIIKAKTEPYKFKVDKTVVTFPVIPDEISAVILKNSRMPTVPTITNTHHMQMEYNGDSRTFLEGTHVFPEVCFKSGDNIIKFQGMTGDYVGEITFEYQEGVL